MTHFQESEKWFVLEFWSKFTQTSLKVICNGFCVLFGCQLVPTVQLVFIRLSSVVPPGKRWCDRPFAIDARWGKKETQLQLRLTSKNESSLLMCSVSANSQVHTILSANLCLFCHQRGIHLVSLQDDDFKSYHSALVKMKVPVWFSFLFNKLWRHTDGLGWSKVNVFFGLLFWGMFGLGQLISPRDQICQLG